MADDTLLTDSLQHYFDDLLQETRKLGENSESSTRPQRMAKPAHDARPQQEPAIKSVEKARLEKLLTTARPRIQVVEPKPELVKPVVAPVKVAPLRDALDVQQKVTPEKVIIKTAEVEQPPEPVVNGDIFAGTEQSYEALSWLPNGRPRWAQERFDVLLFDVAGLTLAVPLIALGQIQPITDELTPLFGQAPWFMGLQPTSVGKLRTVNTALFVMPERYQDDFVKTAKYVVSIDGLPWGLAVNSVNQPISLDPDEVKWRTERSKRPWLAGTVKEHMCALLDIPMMGRMLMEADVNVSRKTPV